LEPENTGSEVHSHEHHHHSHVKGRAGKTTIARLILGRLAQSGLRVAAVDADFNHTLTDWVRTAAKQPLPLSMS